MTIENGISPQTAETQPVIDPVVHHPKFDWNPATRELLKEGDEVSTFRLQEANVFNQLIQSPNITFERSSFTNGKGNVIPLARLQGHIANIRQALSLDTVEAMRIVKSVRGVGYMLVDESKEIETGEAIVHDNFVFYPEIRDIVIEGERIHLTPRLNLLLLEFAKNRNKVISRIVLQNIYATGNKVNNTSVAALNTAISILNRTLVHGRKEVPKPLISVSKKGYRWVDPDFEGEVEMVGFDDVEELVELVKEQETVIKKPYAGNHRVPRATGKAFVPKKRMVIENVQLIPGEKAHHWLIDEANGPLSEGICKHCGKTGKFKNWTDSTIFKLERK
jgi:DNA-binding response OmpR family regulator